MYNIDKDVSSIVEIKKSKFLGFVFYVANPEDAIKKINNLKIEYNNANHVCYMYKIGNIERFSDDGEPIGTSSKPFMQIINGKDLDNVLFVVVRYFGGVKLGVGGLFRAYAASINAALDNSNIVELVDGYEINIKCELKDISKIEYLLRTFNISNNLKIGNNEVDINGIISCNSYEEFFKEVKNYNYKISIDIMNNVKYK